MGQTTPGGDAHRGRDAAVDAGSRPVPLPACPHCSAPLTGLGRYCHGCQRYTDTRGPKPAPAPLPDTRSEGEIRVAIKGALRTLGFEIWDTEQNRPDPRVDAGLSDLIVLGHGTIAFAEIKSATGRLRPSQENFARLVRANGGRACLWRSETDAIAWARGVIAGEGGG